MYIGERKVDKLDWTTVLFADGGTKEYTTKQLQYVVTEEPKDLSDYRTLVMDNVMPEIRVALKSKDVQKQAVKILWIIESHDLTNAEFGNVRSIMTWEVITKYNELVVKRMAKEKEEIEQSERLMQVLQDSYENILFTAMWKAFGTYEQWIHPANFNDNIRVSDLKRLI